MTNNNKNKQAAEEAARQANIEMANIFNDRPISSQPEGMEMHAPRNAPAIDIDGIESEEESRP